MIFGSHMVMAGKINFFIFFLLCFSGAHARQDSLIMQKFREADVVLHIRLADTPLSPIPVFWHDLGTATYQFRFEVLHTYKQRYISSDSTFFYEYGNGQGEIGKILAPGNEYLIFLRCENGNAMSLEANGWCQLWLDTPNCFPYDRNTARMLERWLISTSFDKAVYRGHWRAVDRKIRHRIWRERMMHGTDVKASLTHLINGLRSHPTVDAVVGDTCGIHIMIYPGWVDLGIRFILQKQSPEYGLTMMLGKERRWGCVYHKLGLRGSRDMLLFKSFRESPGVFDAFRKSCIDLRFHRTGNWISQPDVALSITPVQDSIDQISMIPARIRVKLKMVNQSDVPLNLMWPGPQKDGWKIFRFRMLHESGSLVKEESDFLEMPDSSTTGPVAITLAPKDSLVGWHSFNDPFCAETDVTAYHGLSCYHSGWYKIGVQYIPGANYALQGTFWNPEGNSREVWGPLPIYVKETSPSAAVTIKARLVTGRGRYTNAWGQQGRYDALVLVEETPENRFFRQNDTIACTLPPNIHYLLRLPQPRPAATVEIMKPGDRLELDVISNYPADQFRDQQKRSRNNYLLGNSMGAIRFRLE